MSGVRYEITAPEERGDGIVAGVPFTAGRAVVDDPSPGALLYFRRHGYTVSPSAEAFPAGFVANESSTTPDKSGPRPRGKQRNSKEE